MTTANEAIGATDFFAVTRATKNASIGGLHVQKGDYMLLVDDKLAGTGETITEALKCLRNSPINWESKSLLSAFRGADYDESAFGDAVAALAEQYPDLEVQPYFGGQSFYDVVGSVE